MNLFTIATLTGTSEAVSSVGLKLGLVEPSWTFVFNIVNFLILFLILKKWLFKPVTNFMQKRQDGIENSLNDAMKKNAEAEELIAMYEGKIKGSRDEGIEIVRQMKIEAEKIGEEIITEAKLEAKKEKEKAIKEIKREREKAIDVLKNEVSTVALLAASKVIGKELNEEKHREIISKFLDEVGDSKWQN